MHPSFVVGGGISAQIGASHHATVARSREPGYRRW
jgi:hypothetical protein